MPKGRLILKEIRFENCLKRQVIANNSTSGKITLPANLVGRSVYVVIPEEDDNGGDEKS